MLSKNHPIILFIDRSGFSVYQDTLANISKFNFTSDLVLNLDVVNKDQFANLIATFIEINKIIGSSLAVILSDNVIYIRDLVSSQKSNPVKDSKIDLNDDREHEEEVQSFLENVPFEEVLAKVIKTGDINRIVAVNKDLVMTIVDIFASKGSVVEAVIPSFIFGQNANFTTGLTLDNVSVILENAETLKLSNLLTNQERIVPSQNLENEVKNLSSNVKSGLNSNAKKPKSIRQYVLIGVFVVLLIILAIVFFSMGSPQTPPQSPKIKSASANTINISSTPIAPLIHEPTVTQALITPIPLDLKSIKVKITQSYQSDEKVVNLRNELSAMGFQDVVSEISEVAIPEKSSIIFSQSIPEDLRSSVIAEIRKILPDVSVLERQDSEFTINILIGKS